MFEINELVKSAHGRLIQKGRIKNFDSISLDSRTIKSNSVFIALKGDNFDGHNFIKEAIKNGASCIIKEKSCNIKIDGNVSLIEVANTTKALGSIANFRRRKANIPLVAVTGSNGKTTTKEMLSNLLSCRYKVLKNQGTKNNHIGVPLTLLELDSSYDVAVLELGTNHFGEIEYLARICQPNLAIITNIGPSHLEYFNDLEGVFKEKYSIARHLHKSGCLFLNADDDFLRKKLTSRQIKPLALGFSIKNKSDFQAVNINNINSKFTFEVNNYKFSLNTLGYNNIYNALAAIGAARVLGVGYEQIIPAFENFQFPSGRLNIKQIKEAVFIDDTYNSNPFSLNQALQALNTFRTSGRKIFVMGDMLELGKGADKFHVQAGQDARRICDIFITLGNKSLLAAESALKHGFSKQNLFSCRSCEEIEDLLFRKLSLKPDDVVLVKGSRGMKLDKIFEKNKAENNAI